MTTPLVEISHMNNTPESMPQEAPTAISEGQELLHDILDGYEPESLPEWREIIDALDFSLYAVMAARIAATGRVSVLKAQQGDPAVDLARENEILGQGRKAALEMDVDVSAVQGLLLALIGRAHRQHNEARRGDVG